jgi:alkylated DNA repair protein (DNA oxidative demethylase)
VNGLRILPGYLDRTAQARVRDALQDVIDLAPLYTPRMPKTGQPMSVRMTIRPPGWVTDSVAIALVAEPTGRPPAMPAVLPTRGREPAATMARARLINVMDRRPDGCTRIATKPTDAPVMSLSLGDTCLFRIGGAKRSDPTQSVRLASGDAVVLGGDARLAFHGVDRIILERRACSKAASI